MARFHTTDQPAFTATTSNSRAGKSGRTGFRTLMGVLALSLLAGVAAAQAPGSRTMARNGWRWQSPAAQGIYRGSGLQQRVVLPRYNYGYGLNYGYNYGWYGGVNPWLPVYGAGIYDPFRPTQGEIIMAQGLANRANAQAAESAERARAQAIQNQIHLAELRRRQRAIRAEQEEEKRIAQAERRALNAVRLPQSPTELYARLLPEEINPATGEIAWPLPLQMAQHNVHRADIEDTLREIGTLGPSEARALKLRTIVNDMKRQTDGIIADFGFDTYRETRKFLCSLSVEGYYELEAALVDGPVVPLQPAVPAAPGGPLDPPPPAAPAAL